MFKIYSHKLDHKSYTYLKSSIPEVHYSIIIKFLGAILWSLNLEDSYGAGEFSIAYRVSYVFKSQFQKQIQLFSSSLNFCFSI